MAEQNPFKEGSAGENAFKAAYDRLKAESQQRMSGIQSQYGNLYSNLRNQQYAQGLGMAAQSGFSGGQAQGLRGRLGAEQIKALGGLAGQRQQAVLGENVNRSSIYSNALLEGQQAQQYEQDQQQAALVRQQTIDAIVNNKDLTAEEKQRQLEEYGVDPQEAYTQSGQADVDTYGGQNKMFLGDIASSAQIDFNLKPAIAQYNKDIANAKTAQERQRALETLRKVQEQSINALMNNLRITREQAIARLQRRGITLI
jgi:uncharacterized protein YbjQ (UPF0145 family)